MFIFLLLFFLIAKNKLNKKKYFRNTSTLIQWEKTETNIVLLKENEED